MRLFSCVAALVAALLFCSSPLRACIHGPRNYNEVLSEKMKQALVFHDGQNAHLVIQTQLQSSKALPSSMAWVIPLPSLPSRYEEADPKLFSDLFNLTGPIIRDEGGALAGGAPSLNTTSASSIEVHAAQIVGDYKVQPIEILDEGAGSELNRWLGANGFGSVPAENQRFYLRKGAVFLTLKINQLKGALAQVKPLHIVYPSDRLSVPLKFSSHSGVFDLLLYTFTPQKPDPAALSAFHLYSVHWWQTGAPPLSLSKLIGKRQGYLRRFSGEGFNAPGKLVRNLADDPFLLVNSATSRQSLITAPPILLLTALLALPLLLLARRRFKKNSV